VNYLYFTIFIAIGCLIGFAFARINPVSFQNDGEARVSKALRSKFLAPDFHLLNHVTLNLKNGTTQIDHILVSRYGVFVIETKGYSGWILPTQITQIGLRCFLERNISFKTQLIKMLSMYKPLRLFWTFCRPPVSSRLLYSQVVLNLKLKCLMVFLQFRTLSIF
jgi:hypothetical protein